MKNRAIFLDRDGTLNKAVIRNGLPFPPASPEEFEFLPGVKEAITLFKECNYIPVVVTNQPDFARRNKSLEEINTLNEIVRLGLDIQNVYMCLHDDADDCSCRKPKDGLLLEAASELELDLKVSVMVGDRWRDIQAGQNAGCECFFIDNNYAEKSPLPPFHRVTSLLEVAQILGSKHGI
jgi:D-glycero-D-manno-heptose 1,7-bisphosphate phosphatase